MLECKLEWLDEQAKKIRCMICGQERTTFETDLNKIHQPCPVLNNTEIPQNINPPPGYEQHIPPPLITRIKNFSKAAIAHATAGSPTCTQEEIDARFAICKGCELFVNTGDETGICSHTNCGCNLNREQIYLNKLGWADQECPIKKWLAIHKQPRSS